MLTYLLTYLEMRRKVGCAEVECRARQKWHGAINSCIPRSNVFVQNIDCAGERPNNFGSLRNNRH